MAGLACAERLGHGSEIVLFDKGKRPGGRMSTRLMETEVGIAGFDHGAQFLTARDPAFRARVETWRAAGLVAPWPAAGDDALVGVPGMSAPVSDMASRQDVRWLNRVSGLESQDGRWYLHGVEDSGAFDTVVVALPAEQVPPLVGAFDGAMAARAEATPSDPCWALMAAFPDRLPIETDVIKGAGSIGWAARNTAKPERTGPEAWVIQAGPEWSSAHLEDEAASVGAALLAAFFETARIAPRAPIASAAHRWRYAKSGRSGDRFLLNERLRLGACGDWLIGPRVESAWLSGTALAAALLP